MRIKKPGFQEWVRSVNLYGGSVTLNAELAHSTNEIQAATTATADSSKESVTKEASTISSQKSIGWIGVQAQNKGDVAVVTSVAADGPAAKAGIQVGDIIIALDGRLVKGKDIESEVAALKPGTQISVNYAHGTSAHEVPVTVGSQYVSEAGYHSLPAPFLCSSPQCRSRSSLLYRRPSQSIRRMIRCGVLPRIHPMRLRLISKPFDDPDYIFELKHDGFRALAYIDAGLPKNV